MSECGGGGMGSGAATAFVDHVVRGAKRGASPLAPPFTARRASRRRLTVAGSEGGRNEGAEAARASGRGRHGMREHMLRSRESSISHGSDVQPPCGSGQGRGRVGRGQFVEVRCGGVCRDGCVYGGGQRGPPASLLWSRVRGATGGASPPSPSTARRTTPVGRWPL